MPTHLSGSVRHSPSSYSSSTLGRRVVSCCCATACFVIAAAGFPSFVSAQRPVNLSEPASIGVARGQFVGQVQDATGAIVPGARIQIRHLNGVVAAEAQSDPEGQFHVDLPAPGDYRLSVAHEGFEPSALPLHLGLTAPMPMTVTLKVASLATTVTVKAADAVELAAPDANADTPAVSSTDMKSLPLLDNDVVATLSALLNTGAAGEGGATLVVDGVEMKSIGVSASAIERVSINQDPYSAQYRQPGRGQIEVITKSTADRFHGGATWTFRDSAFAATNYFAKVKAPDQRRTYEGFLTGPIRPLKETTFLYSMERREENAYQQVNATLPTGVVNESVEAPYRRTSLTMKVAHQINDHHSIFGLYRFFDSSRANSNVGGQTLAESGYTAHYFDMDLTFHDDLILSPTRLNQFNILFERNIDRTTSNTLAPAIIVQGAFTGGGAQDDTLRTEYNPNISDIVSWTTHTVHQLKFGVQLPNLGRRVLEDMTDRQGAYTYGNVPGCVQASSADTHCSPLAAYAQGIPTSFTVQQGQSRFLTHYDQPGAFFLDQIQATPRLTITPGVRYDFQNAFPGTIDAVLPRLSLAYVLDAKHGLVVRTGAGTYMRRVGVNIRQELARYEHAAERSLLILCNDVTAPNHCGSVSSQPPNLFNFAPGVKAPMQGYFGLSVERQLTKNSTVTVGYNGYRGWHALRSVDVNAPLPPFRSSARPNPNFGRILQQQSGGYQKSDGLTATFRGRLGAIFSGYMQYEYQHADSNTEFSTFTPQNQYDPNAEWSRTNWDQRHRFNLFGTFYPDKPLTLGIGLYGYSALPYTITTGTDDFETGEFNARPYGVPRNSLNGSDYQDLQVRLGYNWKLRPRLKDSSPAVQLSLSSFNTLNRANFGNYIGVVTSPEFMHPTEAGNPRRLQIGAAYNF